MDVTTITQLVGSLGFPIAAYCAIFYELHKQQEQHKQEMDKMSAALNNNTAAILTLAERMKGGEHHD